MLLQFRIIPDGGVAQFYVYKTFTVTADMTVTNTATIEVNGDVPEDEDIAPGEEEDSEETPIDKDEEGGGGTQLRGGSRAPRQAGRFEKDAERSGAVA